MGYLRNGVIMSHHALMAGYGNPQIIVDGADFDGTNDYMTRAGLSGAVDSKKGIISAWMRLDGGDGSQLDLIMGDDGSASFMVYRSSPNKIGINGWSSAPSLPLMLLTNNTYTSSATWVHLLASWDLAITTSHLYINDVSDKHVSSTQNNETLVYTHTQWRVGSDSAAVGSLFNGAIADLYFAPGQYLDFSQVSNRRKFISASGKPVHLGTTGALPTGTAPIMYHHLDNGEAVANFATNRGTGGNFTITGTLDTASSSPSD